MPCTHVATAWLITILLNLAAAAAQLEHTHEFTTIGGNRIAWSCTGHGEPVVVLIAGSGLTAHDSFGRTYHGYDGPGRLCIYDRAGIGESTFAAPETRTLDQLVEELRALVSANGWHDAMLVPHSFGGFIARAYASKYPLDVRAILFLDVAHEDWLPHLQSKMKPEDWTIMERVLAWNERTFHEDYPQAQEAVRSTKLRPDLPITVLSRGVPHTTIRVERMSYEGVDLFENEHIALQERVAALTTNSEHRVARYSSHIFNDYDPWIVIDETKRLIERTARP